VHELSLCQAIVDTARRYGGDRPLRRVLVRIGHLRQVVPDSLQFAWQVITDGTELAGCELAIEHVAAAVECRSCGATTELVDPLLICSRCESDDVLLVRGEEFQLVAVDVVEEVG
jgi:hydrogenase nickel incorporation protein HypA/HybF